MSMYRVSKEAEEITFYATNDPVGFRTIYDLPEDMSEEDKAKYNKESIEIRHPTWDRVALMHTIATGNGLSPFPDDKALDKMLMKYFLVKVSFYNLITAVDEDGMEYVENLDEFLSEVFPALIDFIVLSIRQRM